MKRTILLSLLFLFVGGFVLLSASEAQAQTGRVQGTISDGETGDLLPGATVMIKGTAIGSATDTEGRFVIIKTPVGKQTLVISSIGYENQETTVDVVQGGTVTESIGLAASSTQLEDVVITGLRKSQIDAINRKKQALNTKEVLTTNDIGRLPDINVAEAAQRVSGVSIETDNGEGRFISIRGIQPALNNVTLNNTNIASTSSGRETPLDLLPVEMISSIEVVKAITPDMEGNAVGGSININTISAFDKAQPQFFIASVDGLVQTQQADYGDNKLPFRAAVTAGKRFGAREKFGAVISANFFRRDFSVSVLDPDRWQLLQGTGPDGNPTPGYLGPNEIELQIEDNERDRYGITGDFEYRFTDNNSVYLRSLFTRTSERFINSEFELTVAGLRDQELTNQTPTSGRFSKGSGELDLSSGDTDENLYSFTLGTENRFGALLVDAYGTFSQARQNLFGIDGTFENPNDTEGVLAATYNLEPFFFDITAENQEEARRPGLYNLRNLNFRRDNFVQEDMYEASVDLRYDFNLGNKVPAYIKVGGRVRSRQKEVDRAREEYNDDSEDGVKASNPYTLAQFAIDPFPPVQGGAEPNVHGDAEAFRTFFSNPANLSDTSRIHFRQDDTNDEVYDEDINYREDIAAGYVMGVIDLNYLTLIAGVRVERTSTTSLPWVNTGVDANLGFEQIAFDNSYTNVMPSFHIKANPFDNFIARLSWTNTIGRPNYDELSGTSELQFNTDETGRTEGVFSGANPELMPFESMNLDLSLEYYFKSGGILSGGAFYKNIDNYIFEVERVQNNLQFQGVSFEELRFERNVNLDVATVRGIEASYDQAFTFLPGILSGLGLTANVAFIDSEVEYPSRETDDLPLLRQPNSVFNLIPYYQQYGLEIRAAITRRSAFLTEPESLESGWVEDAVEAGFAISDFDRYEAARTVIDFTAAYTFPARKFKILAQARNLTNAPEQEYRGVTSRYDRHQLFGASYFLGITLNL